LGKKYNPKNRENKKTWKASDLEKNKTIKVKVHFTGICDHCGGKSAADATIKCMPDHWGFISADTTCGHCKGNMKLTGKIKRAK
jgi:hypothetical protein